MSTLQVGDILDHYRIDALAAQSGMASIYRGTDLQSGMRVALKVPHFEVESDPVFFDRFKREEEIGKKLDHPTVIPFEGAESFDSPKRPPHQPSDSAQRTRSSPQLQKIIYRALERNPANRYASACEFANDLRNPDSIGVAERSELRDWKVRRSKRSRMVLFYASPALIPIIIMGLLFIIARRH